jgi:hypothetical protein
MGNILERQFDARNSGDEPASSLKGLRKPDILIGFFRASHARKADCITK